MIFTAELPQQSPQREAITKAYLMDETQAVEALIPQATFDDQARQRVENLAGDLVSQVRKRGRKAGALEAFLHEYDLSSQEGVMLMCLAEALLRVPDAATADRLIHDKLVNADWERHLGRSHSLFVNASTWGLMLTGHIVNLEAENIRDLRSVLNNLITRSSEPVIRMALRQAMGIMAHQFVMGRTIQEGIDRSRSDENKQYRFSFDMLGEAALTDEDAENYFQAYSGAIKKIAHVAQNDIFSAPGISVKLSALHPRYGYTQHERVMQELVPKVLELAEQAKAAHIGLTIDAEEADRLELSLDVFEAVFRSARLHGWEGLGLAVQAYQKRAPYVLNWLADLARSRLRRIPVRLVKGAYWDTEIKRAQQAGLKSYPVFTRKAATDVSYLACARIMLNALDAFYPQFATHNAHTVASVVEMAGETADFEFQRLHGMGESLYADIIDKQQFNIPCRVYAPVGSHEDLLPYLVRRLLENGANTSFVNRIEDESIPVRDIIADPASLMAQYEHKPHPRIPLPVVLYGDMRKNSAGINLDDRPELTLIAKEMKQALKKTWRCKPTAGSGAGAVKHNTVKYGAGEHKVLNPADHREQVGLVDEADLDVLDRSLTQAAGAAMQWGAEAASRRAQILEHAADLFEQHMSELLLLCIKEGGRTLADALSEVREAVDYCRYYAMLARAEFDAPRVLDGPTGERNEFSLHGRGVFACISPWNFPIAIFTGQITAALAAGNAVIAKPARQTPLTAALATELLHKAGIPQEVLHLLPGEGKTIGTQLVKDHRVSGVVFTGSTETAGFINKTLAERQGALVPLIAETGGQNVMLVDSSALSEQVVNDVIQSAFNSAGQRCSALRVLYLQEDIAPRMIKMLQGAMAELSIGDPALLKTDVGPVIDAGAKQTLEQHVLALQQQGTLLYQTSLPPETEHGTFFPPSVFEIKDISILKREVFGPILHIIRYSAGKLDQVLDSINRTGYGLTLGIHSRIDETVEYIRQRVKVGNIYVNRNMIGAVVGVQPFGGEGLSGTGPKAGGPYYLHRFAAERVISVNTAAIGGNTTLVSLSDDMQR
jgi:RHH-type proline utilization regulon transcriptional repressor/proline dehydrogenase/delta 1-pyrroline-5-carboxylate dehydrogenase